MPAYLKFFLCIPFTLVIIRCEKEDHKESLREIPIYIPDSEFLYELIDDKIDANEDSIISYHEAAAVTFLNVSNHFGPDITDLTGIEAFINLEILVCRCNKIADLDLSKNTKLKEIYHVGYDGVCNKNRLSKLDISNNHKLKTLDCSFNLLNEIDVSNNPALEILIVKDMPTLECICVESLSPLPEDMNIYATENTHYQLTTDFI